MTRRLKEDEQLKDDKHGRAAVETGDLDALHARLFSDIGVLSLQQYAEDDEARALVERAVAHAHALVDPATNREDATPSHIVEARAALSRDDIVSALARSRLALELALRDIAETRGIDARRKAGGQIIRQLVQARAIDPPIASQAQEAFAIASRALHGEPVAGPDAEWAVNATEEVLRRFAEDTPLR